MEELNWLSIAGIGLYILAAIGCLAVTLMLRQAPEKKGEMWIWLSVALGFLAFAASRFWQIEARLTAALKSYFMAHGDYAARQSWQAPLASLVLVVCVAVSLWVYFKFRRRKNVILTPVDLAGLALLSMLALIILRIISLHAIDQILFGWRLNWVLDPGFTIMAMGASLWSFWSLWSHAAGRKRAES